MRINGLIAFLLFSAFLGAAYILATTAMAWSNEEDEFCWSIGMSRHLMGTCTDDNGDTFDIGLLKLRHPNPTH